MIRVQWPPVRVSARVEGADKLIVVDEAVTVGVEDARHCIHLQSVGGKLCWNGDMESWCIQDHIDTNILVSQYI